jgi:hypothetical protein
MLRRLWEGLSPTDQQRALTVLSRLVAQQLSPPARQPEVIHEDH